MDEQTQAVKIQRRRSQAEIEQLIAEYEASGLGPTAFCRQTGMSSSTFVRYRKRQRQTSSDAADGKRWLEVEVCGAAAVANGERVSGLAVVLPGGQRIEVGRGFDADTLRRLLAVMERD